MEGNKGEQVGSQSPAPTPSAQEIKGEETIGNRIGELNNAIDVSKTAFRVAARDISAQILIWSFLCIVLIFFSTQFAIDLLHIQFKELWTWQLIYFTAIRLTIITAIFTLASFLFKMLSSHIQMYQHVKHKQAILDSLACFVEAGEKYQQRGIILENLIKMVITFNESGISNAGEKVNYNSILKTFELLSKSTK
jgi:hypothetical protein